MERKRKHDVLSQSFIQNVWWSLLPVELISIKRGFLDTKSILQLSLCSKECRYSFGKIKFSLNAKYSVKFHNSAAFRSQFVNNLELISIKLYDTKIESLDRFKGVEEAWIIQKSFNRDWNKKNKKQSTNLDDLQSVKRLHIIGSKNQISLLKFEGSVVNSVNPFAKTQLEELTLDGVNLFEVNLFASMKTLIKLTLRKLSLVTDVSALGSIHTLTLEYLSGVTDVSALTSVHTLTLRSLNQVTDVSALALVHTLILDSMDKVTDVSALRLVNTLTLIKLFEVTDVSALAEVPTLCLDSMSEVTDVSALGSVKTLTLKNLLRVTDVSALSSVRKLTIELDEEKM